MFPHACVGFFQLFSSRHSLLLSELRRRRREQMEVFEKEKKATNKQINEGDDEQQIKDNQHVTRIIIGV